MNPTGARNVGQGVKKTVKYEDTKARVSVSRRMNAQPMGPRMSVLYESLMHVSWSSIMNFDQDSLGVAQC